MRLRSSAKTYVLLLAVILVNQGCKTQADIQRDRTVETLNQQIVSNQKSNANSNLRLQTIEEQVQKLTGMLDEAQFKNTEGKKEYQVLQEKLATMEENDRKQNEAIRLLSERVAEQTKYLEEVIKSLNTLSDQKPRAEKKSELLVGVDSKNEISVQEGIRLYKAKSYDDAKEIFSQLVDNKKTKRKDKERSLQYLGLIEFKKKNFEEAKVYFSRLFSDYPESSYNATGLLFLARSFNELKQKEEAKFTLDELLTRFPNSSEAKEASKLKTKLYASKINL